MAGSEEVGIYTETLARLYLKQGFVEHALAIYRRLIQEQPSNQQLQERLHTLEKQLALGAPEQDSLVLPTAPHATGDTAPLAIQSEEYRVVAQLERWLYYLQQQRQHREHT